MKYAKMLALLTMSAAALMAFAGSASATTLTTPTGTTYTGVIHADSEGHVILASENAPTSFKIECESTLEGNIERHGTGVTAGGNLSHLTFSNCTNGITVSVLKAGSLEVHSNGTVTSSGAEIQAIIHILGSIKCIYTTASTDVGELTSSPTDEKHATIHMKSLTVSRTGGSAFCGTGGFWSGNYTVTKPTRLFIDP